MAAYVRHSTRPPRTRPELRQSPARRQARDLADMTRTLAPLIPANDAIVIDTSRLTGQQVHNVIALCRMDRRGLLRTTPQHHRAKATVDMASAVRHNLIVREHAETYSHSARCEMQNRADAAARMADAAY
nr:(d)CMP kinase [Amycolatopsis keratiniphila]